MKYGLKLFENENNVVVCRKFQAEEGFKAEMFKNRVVHTFFKKKIQFTTNAYKHSVLSCKIFNS